MFRENAWFKRLIPRPLRKKEEASGGLVCQEVVEIVSDYLENTLLPKTREQMEEHLAGCEGCTTYVEQVRQTIQALRSVAHSPVTPRSRDELIAAFHQWKNQQTS
jgi:anti-sigma factor RsiW